MKATVYQVQAKILAYSDIPGYDGFEYNGRRYLGGIRKRAEPKSVVIATASTSKKTTEEQFAEELWNLCNISCWWGEKNYPTMLSYNDIQITFSSDFRGYCNSDVYIKIDGHLPWRALPFGWTQQFEDTAIYDIVHHDDFIADWKESNEAYDAYIQSLK